MSWNARKEVEATDKGLEITRILGEVTETSRVDDITQRLLMTVRKELRKECYETSNFKVGQQKRTDKGERRLNRI